ncbi:hypothetical protein D1B31_05470 [Neobacillus notoginsengisoli]|uniref:Uncharacterized protein n=1 Tax=Neobacillus notoginsengisoli TaxID=1578198 RepID=A0A417YWW2_9BACI|nr:hypothetical protein [Neobacillus notoginsengisoli]RHW42087.1 hypothetical protein D1B31_05470 [Neobacillus notoginsengisoli]
MPIIAGLTQPKQKTFTAGGKGLANNSWLPAKPGNVPVMTTLLYKLLPFKDYGLILEKDPCFVKDF